MHTHFSATMAVHVVLVVALANTAIRLIAGRLVTSSSPTLASLGKAMAFQV